MKQRPQFLLEAMAGSGHDVWFVDPRLPEPKLVSERIHLVPSLRMTPKNGVILYTHFAPLHSLLRRYRDKVVIYDILDDLAIYDVSDGGMRTKQTVRDRHRHMVRDADLVLVSNPVLGDRHVLEREDLLLVENGVDLDRFTPTGPFADALGQGPIVGFHGAIAPWFDFELVESLARLRPHLGFVLVGPVDPSVKIEAAKLSSLPNVRLISAQPSDRIPEYVRGFAVGVLPFILQEMTRAVTPLKMYEYLASGVPVVATPLPACIAHPAVRTASEAESFASAVDAALRVTGEERAGLRAFAENADWKRRIDPLIERLEQSGLLRVG
jgi:glycosyltransferase involved in cell wall biosynthesis